ncbi:MAG: sulfocyanin-like copper-binding protein [Sulfolobaceae archaeon]|nr:sulfocyanin-like copper-binding protein [Sulfolobaceae archaeon]
MKKPILIGLILLIIAITIPAFAIAYQRYQSYYYSPTANYQGYYSSFNYNTSYGQYYYGGIGYMYSMMQNMFSIMGGYYRGEFGNGEIPISQAIQMIHQIPPYAHVFPSNDSIVFTSTDITLIVLAMGHERAINLTGYIPPSYAHADHDVFVIYGLINPTLIIPAGATVQLIFINLDDNMYHNFVVTTYPPPYPYNVMPETMMGGMMGGYYSGYRTLFYMPYIPYANYAQGYAYEYSTTFVLSSPGTYWYLCTYPGHAELGMYGELIVTGE